MQKQLKSVLKKMDNKSCNRKVHFSPQKGRTETSSEQRKRPLTHETTRKKLKVCQTVYDLHKAEELIIGTENQLRYIESKLQEASLTYSSQYVNVAEIMCDVVALDNCINVFVDDLSHAERQIERCADELNMTELDSLLTRAQEADSQYCDFISSLEQALKLLSDDKVEMLTDQAVTIERQLQKLILA